MIALTFKNRRYVFVDATAGQYTIGVFHISPVAPTVFQRKVTTADEGSSGCWQDRQVGRANKGFCTEASVAPVNIRSRPGNPLGAVVVFVPVAGQYIIGVFRIRLVAPTVFQVKGNTTAD